MDSKCPKKSTMQQLKGLVHYMEETPELARGAPVSVVNKFSAEEEWKNLCHKLNSVGPPTRTLGEWKKTWADLKSRTKKKVGDNSKSLRETDGGLYRYTPLTELEEVVDRILLISSAAAPSGKTYGSRASKSATQSSTVAHSGSSNNSSPQKSSAAASSSLNSEPKQSSESVDDCLVSLLETPPWTKKVAVVTPNRQANKQDITANTIHQHSVSVLQTQPQSRQPSGDERGAARYDDGFTDAPTCSSAKKRKTTAEEQILLIRRQLRVAEQNAASVREQSDT